MATKEDIEAWSEKYGDPLSGGVIISDETGNVIENAPYSADTDTALKTGQKLYKTQDGTWSVNQPTTGAKLDLDTKTGKITIKNLNSAVTPERAKQMISNMKLDTLSSNYKINPDYAYPSSDKDGKPQTVQDIIDSYNKEQEIKVGDQTIKMNAIDLAVNQYINVDNQVAELNKSHQQINEDGTISEINFDDNDILNYFTNQKSLETVKNTSNDKLTNDTRLVIPEQFAIDFKLNELESWDADTLTVGAREFMEKIYNRQAEDWGDRQVKDPTTGSENLDLYIALEKYITGQSSTTKDGQTMFTHRDDKTMDLATAISLYNFLSVDPLCSLWQGAGDVIGSAFNGLETGLEKFGQAGATVVTLLMDGCTWVGNRVASTVNGYEILSEDDYPSHLIAKWAGYKPGTSFYEVSGALIEQGVKSEQADISKYNSAAASVYTASEFITEMALMIATGNALSSAATSALGAASRAVGGVAAKALLKVNALTNGMTTLWKLSGNMAKAANATIGVVSSALQWKVTTGAVSVLAESVGEALIQNPDLVGELLTRDDLSEESRQFIWNTVAGNAIGFGIASVGGKALEKFGETTVGTAVNKNLNRFVWTLKNWAGDKVDNARLFFSKYDNMEDLITKGKASKYEARMNRQMIRAIQKQMIDETSYIELLGSNTTKMIEDIAKFDKSLAKVLSVENAIDYMSSRGIYTAAAMLSDPNSGLSAAHKKWNEIAKDLIDTGKKAGLKTTKIAGIKLLPDDVAEYITTKQHVDILQAYAKAIENGYDVGESLKAINKELEHFSGVLENVTEKLSPDLIAKSDEFIDANRSLWSEWTDYRVERGLLDAAQIEALRQSEQWGIEGSLYVGQLRKVEAPKYTLKRKDNLQDVKVVEELGRYKFGSTDGFVDPMLTFENSLTTSAQKYDRMMVFNQFRDTSAVSTRFTAEQLKLVESVRAGKKSLIAGVKEAYEAELDNIVTGKLLTKASVMQVAGDVMQFTSKELVEGAIAESVDDMVDGLYDFLLNGNSKVGNMLDEIAGKYAPESQETAKKFLLYDTLQNGTDDFSDALKLRLADELPTRPINGRVLDAQEASGLADDIVKRVQDNIKDRFDYNRVELSRLGGEASELIDTQQWYDEISELATEIGDATSKSSNIVTARNAMGELEIYEVSPLLATFMNTDAPNAALNDGMLAKLNYAWMRLFRFGTTGPNPVSWVNQFFRDFGNAWLVGGATRTISNSVDILEEAFGRNPAYYMSQFSDDLIEAAQKTAKETGKTVERVLAETEIEYGSEIVGKQTEAEALKKWRQLRDEKYVGGAVDESIWKKTGDAIDNGMQKLDWVNNQREQWIRSRVYANNYAKAIDKGMSISQARTWAQFYSSNATTNFTRATTFLSGIQNTVPYLRSAINGAKSFWRLWQVDPVGVTGRIIGGLVVPMWGLYSLTLSSEENREVYKNIKEYQKDTSLAFVVDGQPIFIPIPQEVSTVIAPVRQIIESMYNVSTNSFSELAFSDILGLSPLDLSGFAGLDSYKIFEDGYWDHIQAGVSKLAAQCLPKYANTLVALATNRDLYTGNRIDVSYTTVDPDTGEARVMDYTSGQAAKALNKTFPFISAAMAENIMKNTIGQVGIGLGNWIVDLFNTANGTQSIEQTVENMASGLAGAVTSPLTAYVPNDESQVAWRQAVSQMYEYKEQLMNSDEYKAYARNTTSANSEQKIDALSVQRQNIVEPYFDKVKSMVENYQKNYGQQLSQAQLASVISLMVMSPPIAADGVLADEASQQLYNSARASALSTMNRMGFPNTGGQDEIFGRIRTSSTTGEVYVEYNNPIAILDFAKSNQLAPQIHETQIKNLLDDAGLSLTEKNNGYYALDTKAEKKQYRKDWNAKVTKALAPYVQQYGAEAIFRNAQISEAIDDYFYTDNYYSAKDYLQEIFGE